MAFLLLDGRAVRPHPLPVCILLTSFDRGGTERQMTELICRLDPARFLVHVACFRQQGPWAGRVAAHAASISEFPIRSLKPLSLMRTIGSLARWLRARNIAVLHTCDLYANIVGLPAGALARVPVRLGSRRGIVSPVSTPGILTLQRLAYAAAHRVVANSAAAAAQLRREGVAGGRITVVPNGIELDAFITRPRGAGKVVTTVANLRRGKGHDVLLRAAVAVLRPHPDARFRLVGDGPLRATLEEDARTLGIRDRVDFLGHRDDVPALLGSSDLFAFPSLMEAFPNGVMEAMAAGLPIVATDVGGIPELIDHGRNGWLVPPGDSSALAEGIVRLLGRRDLAEACGRAARETIAATYSFDRMVGAFEALYLDRDPPANGRVGSELPIRSSLQP